MKLLLTLGPGLQAAEHGDVVVLDWESKRIIDTHRHRLESYARSHKGLAGVSWQGDGRVLVAGEAELLELSVAPLRAIAVRSFDYLNDVHHLTQVGNRIYVCNTGLDCIEEFDADWNLLQTHNLVRRFGRRPAKMIALLRHDLVKSWRRLRTPPEYYDHLHCRPPFRNLVKLALPDRFRHGGADLRCYDLRPHVLHANFLRPAGDDLWITLWGTGEIVGLRSGRVLVEGLGHPHDGISHDDEFYVTDCLQNRLLVYRYEPEGPAIGALLRQRTITSRVEEGFLRGVEVMGDRIFVALTARRGAPPQFQAARIVALDRRTLEPLDEWSVPPMLGRLVFGLLDVSAAYETQRTTVAGAGSSAHQPAARQSSEVGRG